jgi:hypothetical protein
MNDNAISCREVFGLTVCKFNAERIIFNAMAESQLNVDIFTSDYCPYCPEAISRVSDVLEPLKGMVNINVINNSEDAEREGVAVFPTVKIGRTKITGVPEDDMVWKAVFNESTSI